MKIRLRLPERQTKNIVRHSLETFTKKKRKNAEANSELFDMPYRPNRDNENYSF